MKVLGREHLHAFCKKHADARSWIQSWLAEVEGSSWKTPADIKERYRSASLLSEPNNTVIFDVKGNTYRLEVIIAYGTGVVRVQWIGTHADYDKRNKHGRKG